VAFGVNGGLYTGQQQAGREADYAWVPALQNTYRARE
jgi:hypothetical protein